MTMYKWIIVDDKGRFMNKDLEFVKSLKKASILNSKDEAITLCCSAFGEKIVKVKVTIEL